MKWSGVSEVFAREALTQFLGVIRTNRLATSEMIDTCDKVILGGLTKIIQGDADTCHRLAMALAMAEGEMLALQNQVCLNTDIDSTEAVITLGSIMTDEFLRITISSNVNEVEIEAVRDSDFWGIVNPVSWEFISPTTYTEA